MKKIILVALIMVVCCLCFCGCGNDEVALNITTSDGSKIETTLSELEKEEEENSVSFAEKYKDAKSEFTDEVKSIRDTFIDGSYSSAVWGSYVPKFQEITFKGGICVRFISGSHDNIIKNIKVGSKLKVTTKYNGSRVMDDCTLSGEKWRDNSKFEIVD